MRVCVSEDFSVLVCSGIFHPLAFYSEAAWNIVALQSLIHLKMTNLVVGAGGLPPC